jgi:hypothetical protein
MLPNSVLHKNVDIILTIRESIKIYKTSSSTMHFVNLPKASNRYSTKIQGISPQIHHTSNGESKPFYRFQLYLLNDKALFIFLDPLVPQGITIKYIRKTIQ